MVLDIIIDGITDCLIDNGSGEKVSTCYKRLNKVLTSEDAALLKSEGWLFDWRKPQRDGFEIYQLFTIEDKKLQGMIAVKHDSKGRFTHVEIAESHPDNIGHGGRYTGVGGNLFAVACKESWDVGNEGYLSFVAKSDLIEHYVKTLNAKNVGGQRMIIEPHAAAYLILKYLKEDVGK